MSGSAKRPAYGSVTRGVQTSGGVTSIQDVGERAIVHHFACERREPLRRALGLGVVVYQCPECKQQVSVGSDGQPVGPKTPPVTDRAREALAKLPAVRAALERGHARITKLAVATRLDIDRKTLDAWIGNGWLTWPLSD